jgi:hypothetical protein
MENSVLTEMIKALLGTFTRPISMAIYHKTHGENSRRKRTLTLSVVFNSTL